MKIITKKAAGGFIGMVVPDQADIAKMRSAQNGRYRWNGACALGTYKSRHRAKHAAALMIEINPASFGLEGDSARVC